MQTEGHNDKYTTKEEADSLTISLEAIMLSCVNDVKEEINFIVNNVLGAFLHVEMEVTVQM